MKTSRTFSALVLILACAHVGASAQTAGGANGTVVEQKTFEDWDYGKLQPWQRAVYPKEAFDAARNSPDLELLHIRYMSDGLKVGGFIYKPRKTDGRRLPVIIFNRGGLADGAIGMSNFNYIHEMFRLASEGFVVVASQYRGTDGGEGRDEVGGADTGDVMNLFPLVRSLPYADPASVFMWGYSRGALMTLQALRDGAPVKAAVLVGPPTDYVEFVAQDEAGPRFFRQTWPDFEARKAEHIRNRSSVMWAEKIEAPLLILHGGADNLSPAHSLKLAEKLEEHGKVYELVVYAGDNHPVIFNREDRMRRTIDWFKNPRAMSVAGALRRTINERGVEAALRQYHELKKTQADRYAFGEAELNRLGYELLGTGRTKEAVEIFKLNAEVFPAAFNVYDSLAEAYAAAGDKELAIKNYKKSLELNPQNTNATDRLKELERK